MRPEGWKNPHKETQEELGDLIADKTMQAVKIACYEAGADAYEEGLRKEGRKVDITQFGGENCYVPYLVTLPAKGHLVFIPEEE